MCYVLYCPHCISQQRYPIAIDNISINNQTVDLLLYTSLQQGKGPTANSIAILSYSIVRLHLDVTTENKMDSKKEKSDEIACLQKANTTILT
jgi:hypothetical protein